MQDWRYRHTPGGGGYLHIWGRGRSKCIARERHPERCPDPAIVPPGTNGAPLVPRNHGFHWFVWFLWFHRFQRALRALPRKARSLLLFLLGLAVWPSRRVSCPAAGCFNGSASDAGREFSPLHRTGERTGRVARSESDFFLCFKTKQNQTLMGLGNAWGSGVETHGTRQSGEAFAVVGRHNRASPVCHFGSRLKPNDGCEGAGP